MVIVLSAFGAFALLLGGIGVYGVTSWLVGARLPDFGLRLALGAQPRDVVREALAAGLVPALAGLAVGLVGAFASAGLLRGLLFGVEPADPIVHVGVAATLLVIAAVASWLPARRAARSDPLRVLRTE